MIWPGFFIKFATPYYGKLLKHIREHKLTNAGLKVLQDIPEEFHHTLLDGAIAIGYKYPPNINFDFYGAFLADFEKGIKKIKRFERTKTGTGFIKPQDF